MAIIWSDQLKVLLELQKVDSQIFLLERELSRKPAERKSLEDDFQQKKKELAKADQNLKDLQMRQKDRENELMTKESAVKKYETQQMQVKTNKEYSALTHEINTLKADCALFEDEILRLMDDIETEKKSVEGQRRTLSEEEKKLKSELSAIDDRTTAIKKELGDLKEARQKFTPSVDKNVLAQYERVLRKREGKAIASLTGRSCSGCSMTITHQTVNEIRLKEKMVTCESCGRILYEPEG